MAQLRDGRVQLLAQADGELAALLVVGVLLGHEMTREEVGQDKAALDEIVEILGHPAPLEHRPPRRSSLAIVEQVLTAGQQLCVQPLTLDGERHDAGRGLHALGIAHHLRVVEDRSQRTGGAVDGDRRPRLRGVGQA